MAAVTDPNSSASTSPQPMNRFGTLAWEHWERHRPVAMSTIADPVSYFRELGEMLQRELDEELAARLSGQPVATPAPATIDQLRDELTEELLAGHVFIPDDPDPTTSTAESVDEDLVESLDLAPDSPTAARWATSRLVQPPPPTGD